MANITSLQQFIEQSLLWHSKMRKNASDGLCTMMYVYGIHIVAYLIQEYFVEIFFCWLLLCVFTYIV